MITAVSKTADLLTTPQRGGEPEDAAAGQPTAARTQPASDTAPSGPIDRATVDRAVAKVSEVFKTAETQLRIEIDDDINRVIVKVLREDSGEVIRQFPAKEIVELAKFVSGSKGVLLQERA